MGLLDKVPGFSQLSEKISSSLPTSGSFQSIAGIEGKTDGTVHSGPSMGNGGTRIVGGRKASWWNDEDGTSMLSLSIRGLQTFFPFVNLCIYIALAAFQNRWKVGVSFLVGLGIFFNVEALLHGGILLATGIVADKLKFLRSLDCVMKQIRVAAIVNALQSLCMLLMAIITTVSVNSGGCKDPSKDSHADLEGYKEALPGFCRNKRAGAAFFWLNAVAWLVALSLTLITFVQVRRHPISTGFIPPGSQFPNEAEDFDHPGSAGEHEAFQPPPMSTNSASYRPSHDYAEGGERPFDGGYSTYHHNETGEIRDPFEDPMDQSSRGGYAAGATVDPYEAIKKSMELGGKRQDY
ncbi:hypothetical protein JCM16303_000182 [Sporobolomyces ruberrimus]